LRRGATTFEVRTDAPPRPIRLGGIARALPFAASAGFLAMWIIPGAGPWPLIAAALLTPAGMFLAGRARGGPLPDPARLRRSRPPVPARHAPAAGSGQESWTVDLGNATRTWRLRPRRFTISP